MLWIPVIHPYLVSRVARKDAESKYGQCLLTAAAGKSIYLPSVFMEHLADEYDKECKRVTKRRRSITRLFSKIIEEYELLSSDVRMTEGKKDLSREQIDQMNKEVQEKKDLKAELTGQWEQLDRGEAVSATAMTMGQMRKCITALEDQIGTLEKVIEEKNKLMQEKDKKRAKKIKDAGKYIHPHINLYRQKKSALAARLDRVAEQYEKKLYYYWRALIEELGGIAIKSMKLSDICKQRGIVMYREENILCEQRRIINGQIKDLIGFEVDI